jgi:Core-2/I-Branching enzyme
MEETEYVDPACSDAPPATDEFGRPPGAQPALVILAHADPQQVRRLIDVCYCQPVILHCDRKTPAAVFDSMTSELPRRVILAPRNDTRLASWSLVKVELECIRLALDRTDAEHIVVISGSDYPLIDPSRLAEVLAPFAGMSWMFNVEMPFHPWDIPRFRDGGLWRLRHHFVTRNDQLVSLGSKPLFNPFRRRIHPDLAPRASAQWKILCRSDAQKLLELLDSRPDLVAFGRSIFTPEESFIASVLSSQQLWGVQALAACEYPPCFANWPSDRAVKHPEWFTVADIPRIQNSLDEIANTSDAAAKELPNAGMPLFGRKFTSRYEPELLDKLEAALWPGQRAFRGDRQGDARRPARLRAAGEDHSP